jgi:acyl carrier protein
MSLVTSAIKEEVKELVCEIIDVEPFVVTPTRPFHEYHDVDSHRTREIRATLECAFGVTIDQADAATMTNFEGVYSALAAALLAKHGYSTLR